MHSSVSLLPLLGNILTAAVPVSSVISGHEQFDFVGIPLDHRGRRHGRRSTCHSSQPTFPNDRILLLEAGPAALDEPRINVPGRKGSTLGTKYDWNFTTVPQEHLGGRRVPNNRGKVLSGTSALNLMNWDRPSRAEYDSWERLGNPGWNWKSMYEAMLRVENFTTGVNSSTYGSEGVAFGGPIITGINPRPPLQQSLFIPAASALGIKNNLESLGGDPLGVMFQPYNIDYTTYTRRYSANSYLPHAGRNLEVRPDTLVDKVIFAPSTAGKLLATGVQLVSGVTLGASKEVVLSAGTMQSPGILERSGIGAPAVLDALGVPTRRALAGVGANLQDHVRVQVSFRLRGNYTSADRLRWDPAYLAEQQARWDAGLPSSLGDVGAAFLFANWTQVLLPSAAAFPDDDDDDDDAGGPACRARRAFLADPSVPQLELIASDGYTGVRGPPPANSTLATAAFLTLLVVLQHPASAGRVHATSLDPYAAPSIDPSYLSTRYEVAALREGVEFARRVAAQEPLRSIWVEEYEPGAAVQDDEAVEKYVRETVLSIYHPVGTCAMLPEGEGGVVDPRLRVYGTDGLRVVDASVMPVLVGGHIQTGVYGIAERAADIIERDWKGGMRGRNAGGKVR